MYRIVLFGMVSITSIHLKLILVFIIFTIHIIIFILFVIFAIHYPLLIIYSICVILLNLRIMISKAQFIQPSKLFRRRFILVLRKYCSTILYFIIEQFFKQEDNHQSTKHPKDVLPNY